MIRFLIHRLALAVATLWLLSLITFLLGALAPGGPADILPSCTVCVPPSSENT